MKIKKLKDIFKKGFICDRCGRHLKHAFSVNGNGIYGKECILEFAGIRGEKKAKKLLTLEKIWNKIINNPKVYSLNEYIKEYGNIEVVRDRFFKNGELV